MSKSVTWYLHCAISLCIMIFFRFIPAPEPITPLGMTVLGIFFGAIYGWCTTNMVWPSLIALVMFGLTGYTTPVAAWSSLIGNMSVGFVFWLMLCVGLLKNTNLIDYIAKWSITRKFTEGRPWILFICIFLCDIFCGICLDAIAVILVFWGLIQSVCKQVGYEKGSLTAAWATFTIVVITQFGGFILPFKPAVITCFGFLAIGSNGVYDGTFDYTNWILFTSILSALIFIIYMLVSKYIFKIDLSKFESFETKSVVLPTMTKRQKLSLGLFAVLMVILLIPSFLPKTWAITTLCSTLNTTGCAMLILAIACLIRVDGEPLFVFSDLMSRNVVWDVIFMFGSALTICACINSADAGVTAWLTQSLNPIFSGMSPFLFVACFLIVCIIITNFINNAVVGAIMIPVSYSLSVALDLNPVALCACIIIFVDYGLLLPSASPSGGLLHNSNGWVPKHVLFKYCIVSIVIYVAVSLFIGWPLSNIFF